MANEWNPPYLMQNGDHGTALFRSLLGDETGRSGVVVGADGALAVTQDTGSNMNVKVAVGGCVVPGTSQGSQGSYYCYNDAIKTLTVTAAHGSINRRDIVCATVRDSYYAGATNDWVLQVIKGPEDGTNNLPTLPASSLALANITVTAADTAITNADCVDQRRRVISNGPIVCTNATRPTSPIWDGMLIYETDTDLLYVRANATWKLLPSGGAVYTAPAGDYTNGFTATKAAAAGIAQGTWETVGSMSEQSGAANFNGTDIFTAPVAGLYDCHLTYEIASAAVDGAAFGRIVSNYTGWSSPILKGSSMRRSADNIAMRVSVAGTLPCAASGTLTFRVLHQLSGANKQLDDIYYHARWVSPIPT